MYDNNTIYGLYETLNGEASNANELRIAASNDAQHAHDPATRAEHRRTAALALTALGAIRQAQATLTQHF